MVRSGMILKQSSGAVWKTWFAVLKVKVSKNPFLDGGSGEVHLYAHSDTSDGPRRKMNVAGVRRFTEEETTLHGGCGLVLNGLNGKEWMMRALTEDDAELWLNALGDATKTLTGGEEGEQRKGFFSAWSTAAACAGAAAVSTGATALFVASAATGAGVAVAGVGAAVNTYNRRRRRNEIHNASTTKKSFSEVNLVNTKEEYEDHDRYGELTVSVRMARVMRIGGLDDALPPTLKIDGEVGSKTVNLETPLVFVARCGDKVVGSRPIVSGLDLESIDLRAVFRVTSARAVLRLEIRAGSNTGQLVAARSIGMAEIADRDAEIDVRRTRTQLRAALRSLRALIFGQDTSTSHSVTHIERKEDPDLSSSSSEDEPLEHSRFHARPRPSSSPFQVASDLRVGWYTLYRAAKKDPEQQEEEEEDLEDCSFVEGDCDDAGGVKSANVGGLVLANIVLDRQFLDMLRAERAELDRPARDEAPDPRAILESLKRGVAVVNWATAVAKRCDALLRWDDWRSSLLATVICALLILLWARDYCFALPPAASLIFLMTMGHARLTGDWLVKRVVVGKGGDDDILEGVVACYKDDDRGRRRWRLHRPRDISTLDVSLDRIVFEKNSERKGPVVVVVKFVPGASRAALATRLVAASHVVAERLEDDLALQVKRVCRDAMEAVAHVDEDLVKPNGDWPALAAPLRAFKVGKHTFVREDDSSTRGAASSFYGPAKSSLLDNSTSLSSAPTAESSQDAAAATSVSSHRDEDEAPSPTTPKPAPPSVPPPDHTPPPACHLNLLASSTPARVGIGSRAQYEAERLMAWTSQFVGSQADTPTPHLSTPSRKKKPDPFVESASAKYHERIRSGRKDSRRRRNDQSASAAKWSLPVLRELERDAGGNAYTAAIPTAWRRARGQLRIEVYDVKKPSKKRTKRRIVSKHDAARAIFATAFADKASRYYQPTQTDDSGCYDSDATSQTSAAFTAPEIEEDEEENAAEGNASAPVHHEEHDEDDALGLAPRSDARLVGVAVLPLSRVGPRLRKRWLDVVPVDTTGPRRWWQGMGFDSGMREEDDDDEESDGDDEDAICQEEEKSGRTGIPLRCRVRVESRIVEDVSAVAKDGGVSLSQWQALDTLEDALETSDGSQTREFLESVRRAAGFPDIGQAITVSASDKQERQQSGFRVLERFRRARRSAVEIQNSLNDIVRVCEQWRALIEWVHPKATMVLVFVLVVATYFASKIRADIAGLLGIAAAFGPGLYDRIHRTMEREAPRAYLRRLADDCDAAARSSGISTAASSCATTSADALRSLASSVSASHGAAERMRAAATDCPKPTPAFWRVALASLLEGLPAEPELDAVFSDRRRSAEWRRERAAVARALKASWVGPLWRRSVSWRRHFAAVTDNRQLCFWYSARHALNGVSPVLVVLLNNASLAVPLPETIDRDLPVITIHAPALNAPTSMREWRLAAAHYRDASNLRRCIEAQIDDDDDETDDILAQVARTKKTRRADANDVPSEHSGSLVAEEQEAPPQAQSNLLRRRLRPPSS